MRIWLNLACRLPYRRKLIHSTKSSAFYFGYEPYKNAELKALRYPSINQRIAKRIVINIGGSGARPLKCKQSSFYVSQCVPRLPYRQNTAQKALRF